MRKRRKPRGPYRRSDKPILDSRADPTLPPTSMISGTPIACEKIRSDEHVNDALIAKYTLSLSNWTKGLVFVGLVTAAVLVVHALIFLQADDTARKAQRAFVAVRGIYVTPNGEVH